MAAARKQEVLFLTAVVKKNQKKRINWGGELHTSKCHQLTSSAPHNKALLFPSSLFTNCSMKYFSEEALRAVLSVYLQLHCLPLVSCSSESGCSQRKLLPLQLLPLRSHLRAPRSESLWALIAASRCVRGTVCVAVCNVTCFVCLSEGVLSNTRLQLCCSVLDSMGGAESYRVSVSCVGSPASVHGLDNVPAPQSQKNLEHIMQKRIRNNEHL